jgi:hypothetical protein
MERATNLFCAALHLQRLVAVVSAFGGDRDLHVLDMFAGEAAPRPPGLCSFI